MCFGGMWRKSTTEHQQSTIAFTTGIGNDRNNQTQKRNYKRECRDESKGRIESVEGVEGHQRKDVNNKRNGMMVRDEYSRNIV